MRRGELGKLPFPRPAHQIGRAVSPGFVTRGSGFHPRQVRSYFFQPEQNEFLVEMLIGKGSRAAPEFLVITA